MSDPFQFPKPSYMAGNKQSQNQNSPKPQAKNNNFIEAIKDQGMAATTGVAKGALDQVFGGNPSQFPSFPQENYNPAPALPNWNQAANPNVQQAPFNFAEFLRLREQKIRQQERGLADQQRRTERVLFSQKEEKAKQQIEAIKEEIKNIIKTANTIDARMFSIEKEVMSPTVEAGTYHENFFERILKVLVLIRKSLTDSSNWMEAMHGRNSAKSHYWGNVGKSGAKYLLSNERYMATQAG